MYIVHICSNIFLFHFYFIIGFAITEVCKFYVGKSIYGSWYTWLGRSSAPQGYKNTLLYFLLQVIHYFVVVLKTFFTAMKNFTVKLGKRYRDFLYIAFLHTCIASFTINITFLNGAFLSRMNLYRYIIIIQSP